MRTFHSHRKLQTARKQHVTSETPSYRKSLYKDTRRKVQNSKTFPGGHFAAGDVCSDHGDGGHTAGPLLSRLLRDELRKHARVEVEVRARSPFIHSYIHPYGQTYTHTSTHTYIHACIHTYTHTHIHTYRHTTYILTPKTCPS